jgi:hypothetical protein
VWLLPVFLFAGHGADAMHGHAVVGGRTGQCITLFIAPCVLGTLEEWRFKPVKMSR